MPFVEGLESLQLGSQRFNGDGLSLDSNAFAPAHQVRGGGDTAAESCGTEGRFQKADDGPLSVGTDHLNRGNRLTWMVKVLEGRVHAIQLQIHATQVEAWNQIREVIHSAEAGERRRQTAQKFADLSLVDGQRGHHAQH